MISLEQNNHFSIFEFLDRCTDVIFRFQSVENLGYVIIRIKLEIDLKMDSGRG